MIKLPLTPRTKGVVIGGLIGLPFLIIVSFLFNLLVVTALGLYLWGYLATGLYYDRETHHQDGVPGPSDRS